VDSAFLYLTKKKQPLIKDEDYVKFNKIVATAFNQRRKMLRNSMKSWDFSKSVKEKIDFSRRPESLSVEEFSLLVK
jgi:16S rRNA (adenine1518-N6/adenine1519-N6)-dimethyltransferase